MAKRKRSPRRAPIQLSQQEMDALNHLLATAEKHFMAGEMAEAEALYRRVLKSVPQHARTVCCLGITLLKQDRLEEAEQVFRRAINVQSNYAEAHLNLGFLLQRTERVDKALASFQRAVELKPDLGEAWNAIGGFYYKAKRFDDAANACRKALATKSDVAMFHNSYGCVLCEQKKYEDSVKHLRRALQLDPDFVFAYVNIGKSLRMMRRFDEAVAAFKKAVELDPDNVETLNSLGHTLNRAGEPQEAAEYFQRALEIDPEHIQALNNLCVALNSCCRYDEAIEYCNRALELKSDFAEAHLSLGLTKLRLGEFEQGWAEYDWRWECESESWWRQDFPEPRWEGEPLEGKRILLHWEQGFGDVLQFIRYAPLVAKRGGRVSVICQHPLMRLMSIAPSVEQVFPAGEEPPEFDYCIPLASLPKIFKTTVDTIPNDVPYLRAADKDMEEWKKRFGEPKGLRVGLVWAGSSTGVSFKRNRITLEMLKPLLAIEGAEFFGLQVGEIAGEIAQLPSGTIVDLSPHLNDFADTAAAISQLDLVISIDTAVVHLAGAMGKDLLVMLTYASDWRWMIDRTDSPWYPTAKLFRQQARNEWGQVIEAITAELRDKVAAKK